MKKLIVFYGEKDLNIFKEMLSKKIDHTDYDEIDFTNVSAEDRVRFGGEGRIVLNTLSRFIVRTLAEVKSGNLDKHITAFIDGFISKVDESVDIVDYISALLEEVDVFYRVFDVICERLKESEDIIDSEVESIVKTGKRRV